MEYIQTVVLMHTSMFIHFSTLAEPPSFFTSMCPTPRVPQCLLYLQVLEYSPELKEKLLAGEHLEPGGEMEAEIRGCSIWAVEVSVSWQPSSFLCASYELMVTIAVCSKFLCS